MNHENIKISFSIVSHGQGHLIKNFLSDLAALNLDSYELILTLNIYEDENFLNKNPKAQESEQDMIDFVQNADKSSRLSCQIIITNDLDGIVVRLPKTQS